MAAHQYTNYGTIVPLPRAGCRSAKASAYFSEHVSIPPWIENCQDSISMTEYVGGLRVYYIFRQYKLQYVLDDVFRALGLNPADIDVIVTNYSEEQNRSVMQRAHPRVPVIHFERVLPLFWKVQNRDCGWHDSAVNPGLPRSFLDIHPCMPGIPDDELNVLLLMLAHGLTKVETGMPQPCPRCPEYGYDLDSLMSSGGK